MGKDVSGDEMMSYIYDIASVAGALTVPMEIRHKDEVLEWMRMANCMGSPKVAEVY